jgi:hypothetical protein
MVSFDITRMQPQDRLSKPLPTFRWTMHLKGLINVFRGPIREVEIHEYLSPFSPRNKVIRIRVDRLGIDLKQANKNSL